MRFLIATTVPGRSRLDVNRFDAHLVTGKVAFDVLPLLQSDLKML